MTVCETERNLLPSGLSGSRERGKKRQKSHNLLQGHTHWGGLKPPPLKYHLLKCLLLPSGTKRRICSSMRQPLGDIWGPHVVTYMLLVLGPISHQNLSPALKSSCSQGRQSGVQDKPLKPVAWKDVLSATTIMVSRDMTSWCSPNWKTAKGSLVSWADLGRSTSSSLTVPPSAQLSWEVRTLR